MNSHAANAYIYVQQLQQGFDEAEGRLGEKGVAPSLGVQRGVKIVKNK